MSATTYVQGNIFVELGLANLPEERKLQMLQQMNELIHKRVMLRVMAAIPEQQTEQTLQQMQGLGEEEQMKVVLQHVPNLPEIILEEIQQMKQELMTSAKK